MSRNDYLNKQIDQVLIKYQSLYEVYNIIKDECFQVLPRILRAMKEDSLDEDILNACDAILNRKGNKFSTKVELDIIQNDDRPYPLVKLEHVLENETQFHIKLYLAEDIEVITDYTLSMGWGSQLEWPYISVSEEVVQISKKINQLNGELLRRISNLNGEIKPIDKVTVDDLPDDIKQMLYGVVVNDFIKNGFALERVQDKEHLAEILSKYETEYQMGMRLLIKDYTANKGRNEAINQLFSQDDSDWPMPQTILNNMQVLIEVIQENAGKRTEQQISAQPAMLQILATQFERLEHTEKLSAYHTMTSNQAFDKNVLDDHFLFNRFAVHHECEIEEFKSSHQLANLIDDELQNISSVENENRQHDHQELCIDDVNVSNSL